MIEPSLGTLAILGASARSAALSAKRAGVKVVAADLFADADLARQVESTRIAEYPQGFLPWLQSNNVSAWMYIGALENYPRLVDELAAVTSLCGNSGKALRAIRSPWRLASCLREAGLNYPEVTSSCLELPTDGSWLRKPLRGSNGSGIEPWLGKTNSPVRQSYWQRRVRGTPCAALFVASDRGPQLLGVTKQLIGVEWTGAKPFQYSGTIGPWPTTATQLAQIERIGQSLVSAFAIQGLFGVDLMIDGDTIWTIEVNPRYTAAAEVVERFSGVNSIAAHLAACHKGGLVPDLASQSKSPDASLSYSGKAILYAKSDFIVTQQFFDWTCGHPEGALADIPHVGTSIRAGQPVLTVLAEGDSWGMVEQNLQSRVKEVRALCR